jgi:uncharacterized protein YabN with tetrapyrrole methylase and pyrophosphatase domain
LAEERLAALERLDGIVRRLRRECPWDREQDARSIVPHTVEESYELADAARRDDAEAMVDELGDVLFQVLFLSLLLEERGLGDFNAVAEACAAKLVRRHPHVFADRDLRTADEVLRQWEQIKREVEGSGEEHPFATLPENLPALTYTRKVLRRLEPEGSSAGAKPGGAGADPQAREASERWIGELLLSATALARRLGVDPELALRASADRLRASAPGQ